MKSVHAGQLRQVSASQIGKFDPSQVGGCNRRWYFDKVLGFSEPSTKSQEKGTSIHGEIEHYLKTGENILRKEVIAGLQFIPSHEHYTKRWLEVEVDLKDSTIADVPLTGRIDALNTSPFWIDEQGEQQEQADSTIEVIDWKTSSNLDYAKTGLELFDTVQMPLYGYQVRELSTHIRLSHVYFQTRGAAKSVKRTALFSVDKITERYNALERVVEEMKLAAQLSDVAELPANLDSCMSFGRRCSYWDKCPRAQQDIFDLYFGVSDLTEREGSMGLFDKVATKKTETTNGAATMPLKELAGMPDVKAQLLAEEERARKAFGIPQGIVPPDARPSEGPGTFEPEPAKAAQRTFTMPTQPAQPSLAVFTKPLLAKQDEALVAAASPSKDTLELFVNVYVRGVETSDLQTVINQAVREIEAQYSTPDIRLGKEPLAYGGWKGVLASTLKSYNLSGRWSVNGQGDFINVAIEALETQASLVVKGV